MNEEASYKYWMSKKYLLYVCDLVKINLKMHTSQRKVCFSYVMTQKYSFAELRKTNCFNFAKNEPHVIYANSCIF